MKRNSGQFSAWNHEANYSLFAVNAKNLFYGSVGYEYQDYRFHNTPAWFDDCQRANLSLYYERIINSNWSLLALAGGALAAEENARWEDAATGRIGTGVKYKISKDLSISTGVMVASKLSDDAQWLPYASLDWQISPHWSLRTAAGVTLAYDVFADKMFRIEIAGAWHGANFRLRNTTDVSGTSGPRKRALEGREGVFTLGITKEFFKRAGYIRANVGSTAFTKYKIRSYGSNLGEFECDPTFVFSLEAGFRF
jgi:hypothetical protein